MTDIAKCPEHPGGPPVIVSGGKAVGPSFDMECHVVCGDSAKCWTGPVRPTAAEAIAAWDKVVGAVAEAHALREALYPLVVGCLEADAREDAPEFDNDEAYNGVRALPECKRCEFTGARDKKNREDETIPEHLLCPDCGGWGFLKHPKEGA